MAYSRWSNSRWYTYWLATEDKRKNKQKFEICDTLRNLRFTYKELKKDIEKCLDYVCKLYGESWTGEMLDLDDDASFDFKRISEWKYKSQTFEPDPVSQAERDELKGYMLQFLKDVDNEFKKKKKGSKT